MISMTYGVLPSKEAFEAAYQAELGDSGFRFGNDKRVGDCVLSCYELWDELVKAKNEFEFGNDEAGDWASCVLSCLHFEWI
jgi:hypothetical protein